MVALAAFPACRRNAAAVVDGQERRDPAIQAAWAASETGGVACAEPLYDAILLKSPDLARAHLDLAMLLMNAEEKPVKAMHHFQRYLELQPESEKRVLIAQNIRKLTLMLGGKVARSRIGQLEQQLAALQAENDTLKRSLGISGLPVVNPAAPGNPAGGAGAPAPGPRAYTVKEGDSLTRISQAMYGDGARSDRIYEANRAKLKNRNALQSGQVLVIP
jgi:hypothetical protein